MSKVKILYLIGGLGNNLFQIEKSLSSQNSQVRVVTNLIEDRFYSRIFGWTYHKETVSELSFKNDVEFIRLNSLLVLIHLCLLFFSKFTNRTFLGVSWESYLLTRVNFGYWQIRDGKDQNAFKLKIDYKVQVNTLPVVHVRMGDSPTICEDLNAQLELMKELNFDRYLVITNDKESFIESAKNFNFEFEARQRTVAEDLLSLLSAKTLIIPQSTFSLVASFMSDKLEVLYVNPIYWLRNGRYLNDVSIKYYQERD